MIYRNIEGIQKSLSALVYGTGNAVVSGTDKEAAFACLDLAWQYGFRVFDSAHIYGNAEENLGSWLLSRGYREQAVLLDKGCNPGMEGSCDVFSAATVRGQIEESFRRLRTDHIDCYLLHRDDERRSVGEIVEILNEYKEKGKIDAFGGSNWKRERIEEADRYAKEHGLAGFTLVSPCFSLAELKRDIWGGSVKLSGKENEGFRRYLKESGKAVFCYSSLARGYLSGKFDTRGGRRIEDCLPSAPIREYDCPENRARLARAEKMAKEKGCTVSQLCLKWILVQGLNAFPIVGPSTEEHIRECAEGLDVPLGGKEAEWLLFGE